MSFSISDQIKYIGADDTDLDLFESQYIVPNGVSYNSYLILDEKIAVMDTIDKRKTEEWLANLAGELGDKMPDYLVVSHMEPDHAASIERAANTYPSMKIVGNMKTLQMMKQFFETDFTDRFVEVKEGDKLSLGEHELTFLMAPMVHWPEVMVEYESKEKILFSADGFGKFGALSADEDWACEARRYYFNIVGKYGVQVQALLKKAATLDIQTICPLHGPILTENLSYYIDKYNTWSSYSPEDKGILVASASIHGNTKAAALKLVEKLEATGVKVAFTDLTRDDMAEAIEDAFRYDRMVVCACTYDGGLFPAAESFIAHLKSKNYQNRTVGFVENGSWAPMAAKHMRAAFETMKNITLLDSVVTIKSTLNKDSEAQMDALVAELTK
ncbi:MAG: FprA family A-type flavoprotein [Lachnospiraceae bacterium]|nr:FprA family A-type flavoprotein [Lachnospiraceae bacterium]